MGLSEVEDLFEKLHRVGDDHFAVAGDGVVLAFDHLERKTIKENSEISRCFYLMKNPITMNPAPISLISFRNFIEFLLVSDMYESSG